MRRPALLVFCCAAAFAQPALAPPQIGIADDGSGTLRALFGVAGNFVWGDAITGSIDSAAFSGTFGLIKIDSNIVVVNRQGGIVSSCDAPSGGAMFAFASNGSPALAYAAGSLFRWSGGAFQQLSFDPASLPGSVESIFAPDPAHAGLIVQNDQGLWDLRVDLASGSVDQQSMLGNVTGPALRLASGEIVASDAAGIVILHADGSEIHLAAQLPAGFTLSQMGDGWVQLEDLGSPAQFAIRVSAGREALFALPGVNP